MIEKKHLLSVGAGLVILLAGLSIMRSCWRPDRDQQAVDMHRQAGATLAELARKTLGGAGRVLVLEPSTEGAESRERTWLKGQLEAFYEGLGSDIAVQGKETLPFFLPAEALFEGETPSLSLDHYLAILKQYPDANVVVSFVGEPIPKQMGRTAIPDSLPPMVCISHFGKHLGDMIGRGVVHGAIAPRSEPVPIATSGKEDWFSIMYQVVTPENVDTLTGFSSSSRPNK